MAKRKPVTFAPKTGGDYDMLNAALEGVVTKKLENNTIVRGVVTSVTSEDVFLDIGYKSEGVVARNQFENQADVKPGDEVDVFLEALEGQDGMVRLSKAKADEKLRWDAILGKYTEGVVVTGLVTEKVRGGMVVKVDGVEAFLPGSQLDVSPVHDLDALVGQTFEFKVIKINHERRNIIVSRRELIESQIASKKSELLYSIAKGQVRQGKVKNITDFGAFIDLDGLDGLLHITDMSWGRIKHPSEILKPGQTLDVMVLDVDMERERVSLGLKQAQANPWEGIEERLPTGSRLRGKVVNLVPYGAFVEIEPGVEGLVHVSEFSWTKRITRASDILDLGQEVDVVVLNINREEQKIALGMRQTEANPWDTVRDRYPIGSRVSGKVRSFTSYGAFVELEEGIDGMVHVSDLSWTRKVNHPSEILQKGQHIEAVVLDIEVSEQRISLGLKQALGDPWAEISSRFQIGQIVKGKVTKTASFGAFVSIEEGVDGLVHISQLSDHHVDRVKDAVKIGQEVEARVVKIDREERRIGLSIKAVSMNDEEIAEITRELNNPDLKPGENLVGLAAAFNDAFAQVEEWQPGAETEKE